ncbi:MAG TPA: glycosyl hydrolase family 8 [Acidimicrobiales bacterium]
MALVALAALAVLAGAIALGIGTSGGPTSTLDRSAPRRTVRPPGSSAPERVPVWAADQAFGAAMYFLDRYELPSGRVVRWDQGADTVSEGEAYAMLLSVAAGDRTRFDEAWGWTRSRLLQADGLLAWHWAHGQVLSTESATDADVDAAYALELAAVRFDEPTDLSAAISMASAIEVNETVATPEGRVLAAGPWAVGPPSFANPSYASPSELAALAQLPGEAEPYTALAVGERALVAQVLKMDALPPDWVELTSGAPIDVTPQDSATDDRFGFDAVRLPIRWAASCTAADRKAAASLWPALRPAAERGRATVDLRLRRGREQGRGAVSSPVGLVAAAASAWAAGRRAEALALLARAEALNRAHPTYYSSAWVALGRVFLETGRLGTCTA